jgi:hypothetical protein
LWASKDKIIVISYPHGDLSSNPPSYRNQPHVTVHKAEHKAYYGIGRKDHHATVNGGHDGYLLNYVQDKAEYDTPKFWARHNNMPPQCSS